MFFRGRTPEASIWRRFRASADGFTFTQESDYYAAHVVANAERVVDLFYTLAGQLSPAVDIVIEDLRSGRSWKGEGVALPDVREQVAKMKILLARFVGVELSVFTSEAQLTLNPHLELLIYARTDRWLARRDDDPHRLSPRAHHAAHPWASLSFWRGDTRGL